MVNKYSVKNTLTQISKLLIQFYLNILFKQKYKILNKIKFLSKIFFETLF